MITNSVTDYQLNTKKLSTNLVTDYQTEYD